MFDQEGAPAAEASVDFRLPPNVVPEFYELRLEPDLRKFTFAGAERVAVTVRATSSEVVLNALELEIDSVTAERDAVKVGGRGQPEATGERARLIFERPLEPGPWTLVIAFRGALNDKLHGFYRSQYRDAAGVTHIVATTQFEATDARRAFPCWDEPALKARFRVTLVVDENLAAFSNTAIDRERRLGDGRKEVVFKETIRMSTYLLALVVGEFEATEPVDAAGVPLRVVHVAGKRGLTAWAREIGGFSLRFYTDYYGIKYPGDKLDLIAIPDFAAGAMENLGAITFRETALLADERTAARAELERVADVVSHENAHMWFGDLVTMEWWNGIWLNEAFATFMEMLAVDAFRPAWKRWESFSAERASAMTVDGLESTRSIEYPVHGPEEARAMFDVLTYQKGASVLRMLQQYLGAAIFRSGISAYLRKHEYANASTADLWDALQEASGEPVRKLMDSWIFQQGFPVVEVSRGARSGEIRLAQRRFLYLPGDQASSRLWHVPLIIRSRGPAGLKMRRVLLTAPETTVDLGAPFDWVLVNEGGHGFYRVAYAPELRAALARNLGELEPAERFGLVSDGWAAVLAATAPLGDFLRMLRLFSGEGELSVWRGLLGVLNYLEMMVHDGAREPLCGLARELAGPALGGLGWSSREGEPELTGSLRATLIGTLGGLGEDGEVRERAAKLYAQYLREPGAVNRDLVPALINVLAYYGDAKRFEEFRAAYKSAITPQEEQRYLYALARFRDPALLRVTMEMTLNGEVRTQNGPYLLLSLLSNDVGRYEAWDFVKRNWDEINNRFPDTALPRMCEGVVWLTAREADVRQFFTAHRVRLGGKLIDQHLERLAVAVGFERREGPGLADALRA